VSRDSGATWATATLSSAVTPGSLVLSTANGTLVYALARIGTRLALFRSADAGTTWTGPRYEPQWGIPSSYGISVGTDGGVQVFYVAGDGDTTFTRSNDNGVTFVPTDVPFATGGPIVAVPGGYVMLGFAPKLSTDGRVWESLTLPSAPVNG
jgi:hypothetical protein